MRGINIDSVGNTVRRHYKGAISEEDMNFSWVDGKLAGCAGPLLDEDLRTLYGWGVRALVRLADINEANVSLEQVKNSGMDDCHEPIPDFNAPTQDQIDKVIGFIFNCLKLDKPVAVSCGAGCGRTGTILCCYFVSVGLSAEEAIKKVRAKGRTAYEPQAQGQLAAIQEFERRCKAGSGRSPDLPPPGCKL